MALLSPNKTHTISEFINSGNEVTISYEVLSFIEKIGDIKYPIYNVFQDYIDDFREHASTVALDDRQYFKYKYKPKLFCQDIYGNTELYFVIMMLNGIADVKEFDFKKFLAFKKSDMVDLVSSVYNAEKRQIELYTGLGDKDTES